MYNYLWTLGYIIILNFIYVLVAVVAWYHLWIKGLGEKNVAGLDKRQLFYTTRSPSILYEFFKKMLSKFDRGYWSAQCGQDAYLYLLFQRKLIRLAIILAISSMVVSLSINLFASTDQQEWFERSSLNNKQISPITAWVHCGLALLFSLLTFYTVFDLREEARDLYRENQKEKCKVKDYEWLKARTLHVRGLLPKDRRGDMLKNELNLMLEPIQGKVLDVVVIPDFQRLFDLEIEKKDLDDLHHLVAAHGSPGCGRQAIFKCLWTQSSSVQERQVQLDQDIQNEIEKPFLSSGHAFVVLDSVKSLNHCVQQSNMTPTYAWRLAKVSVKENIQQFFSQKFKRTMSQDRQTFNQFEDEDLEIAQGYRDKDLTLIMSEAGDPIDIIWGNMGGTRGVYFFRKVFFNIIGLSIVFFLSTPAAIYSTLKMIQFFSFLDITTKVQNDSLWGSFLTTFFPPLVIIFINNILLYMIYYSAYWEKRVTHSKYQYSIFNKAYIYLALNMLIIPAVTITSQSSMLQVVKANNYNLIAVLSQFYSTDSGVFFVSMLIQNACLSLCTNLVRSGDIGSAFFSPWLSHYRRKYINDAQVWRRREFMVFQYGFYYAQHLVIFAIILVFASTVPMTAVGGILFFGMRHIIDSYNLLTLNRKEIDSSCKVFQKILLHIQFAILLLQLCLMSFLYQKDFLSCACFMALIFAISSIVVFLTNKSLFDIAKQDQSIFNDTQEPTPLEEEIGGSVDGENSMLYVPLMKWRQEYNHPLMIGANADRSEAAPSTKGDGELKNLEEVKAKNNLSLGKGGDRNQDQMLKEMIFASSGQEFDRKSGRYSNNGRVSGSQSQTPNHSNMMPTDLFGVNPFGDDRGQAVHNKKQSLGSYSQYNKSAMGVSTNHQTNYSVQMNNNNMNNFTD
ncbi:transmembrane protein 63c [Stylonychia lemnae]|uniref:Transmembrane protein 63c n=1 Tax=Stylonychia lemnae TaxID=5949 RepID=A0A078AGN0_STYLE|nr:transmembrane protein 63c [Stylonychia lemnae]|eukprot:CDW80986.1 transmembrane protein 63c [Stylonychia lemnae]